MKWQAWMIASLLAFYAQPAAAQTLLERLERRLNEANAPPVTPNENAPAQPAPAAAPAGYLGLVADAVENAVIVHKAHTGGPADLAGLRRGDRLIAAGGVELTNLDDLAGVLGKLPPGARVDFIVERGGENRKVVVFLGEPPADNQAEALPPPADPLLREPIERPVAGTAVLGVRATSLTADSQRRYGLTVRQGAVIDGIQEGSPAARYGLPIGAAIVAIDGARVDSPDELAALIAGYRPGDNVEISYYVRDQAYRKQVRLAPAAVAVAPQVTDRPLLRTLERALDSVAPPAGGGEGEVQALRAHIAALQERIELLEARIEDLEAKNDAAVRSTPPPLPRPAPALESPLEPLTP
jgi:S1-C subfamily serine protease